ncbi:MAG: Uma2 family endonuclease [Caldilineaceae bacterium]|nr:Uma2 family endonuclease [Caldilineaceae bacterium]
MQWKDVVTNPSLQDLPFKIETNEWGQIVMTPTRNKHGALQFKIAKLLDGLMQQSERKGTTVTESAIQTSKGTKVADIAWFSQERWLIVEDEFDAPIAPEICVEVLSPGNSTGEINEKKALYFAAGAYEVWVCHSDGSLSFYNAQGKVAQSNLVPNFPKQIA